MRRAEVQEAGRRRRGGRITGRQGRKAWSGRLASRNKQTTQGFQQISERKISVPQKTNSDCRLGKQDVTPRRQDHTGMTGHVGAAPCPRERQAVPMLGLCTNFKTFCTKSVNHSRPLHLSTGLAPYGGQPKDGFQCERHHFPHVSPLK